jgi:hypothetical protein
VAIERTAAERQWRELLMRGNRENCRWEVMEGTADERK